ncbi:MAG: ferritin-like domain-containing protein [Lautropia sp.]
MDRTNTLRTRALAALAITDPAGKVAAARALGTAGGPVGAGAMLAEPDGLPGRPPRPRLVPHTDVWSGSVGSREGRAALLHAIAHIEFNAIDLALDAVWRFPGLPDDFYRDWARVADDEARHFMLLADHLATLGFVYGDFDAHHGLWDMAERTRHDPLARLGLVPRTLEARGLDASPPLRRKLAAAGDLAAAAILDVILADEIGHVAIGNRWYRWLCEQRGLDPLATFAALTIRYDAPRPRAPLNLDARRAAGFSEAELVAIEAAAIGAGSKRKA